MISKGIPFSRAGIRARRQCRRCSSCDALQLGGPVRDRSRRRHRRRRQAHQAPSTSTVTLSSSTSTKVPVCTLRTGDLLIRLHLPRPAQRRLRRRAQQPLDTEGELTSRSYRPAPKSSRCSRREIRSDTSATRTSRSTPPSRSIVTRNTERPEPPPRWSTSTSSKPAPSTTGLTSARVHRLDQPFRTKRWARAHLQLVHQRPVQVSIDEAPLTRRAPPCHHRRRCGSTAGTGGGARARWAGVAAPLTRRPSTHPSPGPHVRGFASGEMDLQVRPTREAFDRLAADWPLVPVWTEAPRRRGDPGRAVRVGGGRGSGDAAGVRRKALRTMGALLVRGRRPRGGRGRRR